MFNLCALLNSFGKNFYQYVGDETLKKDFDLYKFLESAFGGEFRLSSNPDYLNTDVKKTINVENDNCSLNVTSIDMDNERIIFVDSIYKNAEKITFGICANASVVTSNGIGFNALFDLTDNNRVVYYGADNIKACRKLVGKNNIDDSDYLTRCLIEPNASLEINVSDDNFETNVGSFVKEHANQKLDKSFDLDSFIDKITADLFKEIDNVEPFKVSAFINDVYGEVQLPVHLDIPAFSGWSLDHSDTEKLCLDGKNKGEDSIKITYSDGISSDKTLDIAISSADYKLNTTIGAVDGNVSYVMKLVKNCPNDGMADAEVCSIIAGDLNTARYYGNETIDVYSKLKNVAFKMEIADDNDFNEYFIEPDEILEIDPSVSLDKQVACFTKNVFFNNELNNKEENVLSLVK